MVILIIKGQTGPNYDKKKFTFNKSKSLRSLLVKMLLFFIAALFMNMINFVFHCRKIITSEKKVNKLFLRKSKTFSFSDQVQGKLF